MCWLALIARGGQRCLRGGVKYASPQAAFEQGLGAYKSGYYEIAIPALEEAAGKGAELNKFFAEFYLARIYSDNASARHRSRQGLPALPEARRRQRRRRSRRRPARALRRQGADGAGGLLRRGVKEIGLEPDPGAPSTTCTTRRRSSATRTRSSSWPRSIWAASARPRT